MSIFYKPHCDQCKDWVPIMRRSCPNWIKETIALHPQECADWQARAILAQQRYDAELREIRREAEALYSLAEQRTYLRARKKKRGVAAPSEDYRVCSDHVITSRPGKWRKKLILQWLMEMN